MADTKISDLVQLVTPATLDELVIVDKSDLTMAPSGTDKRITFDDLTAPFEETANKNAAGGYAGLDGSSKLTGSQQTYGSSANTACQGNDARLSDDRTASGLRTATTIVAVSAATAPSSGQVLTATSGAAATWQTPSAAGLSNVAPVDVDTAAASAGVSAEASRQDHKHDVATAAPGTIQPDDSAAEGTALSLARSDHRHAIAADAAGVIGIGDSAAEGSATSFSRSDHRHALAAPAAPADVTKAAASAGASTTPSRADHKHDVSTAAPAATGVATASGEGSATSLARSDHTHQSNTAPADVTKAAAAIGTSGEPARADHKHDVATAAASALNADSANAEGASANLARADHSHDIDTAGGTISTVNAGDAAAEGTGTGLARRDHQHAVATAAAVDVGTANTEGSSTSLSRADHVHNVPFSAVQTALASVGFSLDGSGNLSTSDNVTLSSFAAGRVVVTGTGGLLSVDTALLWDATDDRLTVGTGGAAAAKGRLQVKDNTTGSTAGGSIFSEGAAVIGPSPAGAFNCASIYTALVIGSYINSTYDGGGNGGLYAIARVGTPGSPPTLVPFTALSGYDEGTSRSLYFGGGGWTCPDANDLVFYTAPTYTEVNDTGIQRMHINPSGQVLVGLATADSTGCLRVGAAVGGVALRVDSVSPSRIGTGGLNVGTDANPTAGFMLVQQGAGGTRIARAAATTGAASNFLYVGAAHTGQTAGTETPDVDFSATATLQHATGALATQRTFIYRQRTYSFVAASTITDAATVAIVGAPVAGTNATITNSRALWVQAGAVEFDGETRIDDGLYLRSIISPTAITGTNNNYSPTSLATATVIRQDASGAATLTGLVAQASGRSIILMNISATNTIVLNHDNAGSTAANRFFCPNNANLTIRTNGAVEIWYDTTSSRWRVVAI